MKLTTYKVWDLDDLLYKYATKHKLNAREFGDMFMKKYITEPVTVKVDYVDVCFNVYDDLDKSITDFMGLDVPLGDNLICVTFRL